MLKVHSFFEFDDNVFRDGRNLCCEPPWASNVCGQTSGGVIRSRAEHTGRTPLFRPIPLVRSSSPGRTVDVTDVAGSVRSLLTIDG